MKKELFTEKGFEHTEKRFAYIHKTNPRQIAAANSHGKKPRQIPTVSSCGKFPRKKVTANSCG